MSDSPVWIPDPMRAERSHMRRFMRGAERLAGHTIPDYETLHRWSVAEPGAFWAEVARYTGMRFSRAPDAVLENADAMPGAKWFPGAELNFAANLLAGPDEEIALICRNEAGARQAVSRGELRDRVARLATGLRAAGIRPGDRVAAVLPNRAETVEIMLAAASIGAIFSACAPEFGPPALLDRLTQIRPSVLFICDHYSYAGKEFRCLDKLREVAAGLKPRPLVVRVPGATTDAGASAVAGESVYADWLASDSAGTCEPLSFDHPLYILYSSGTTGKPKCIVHSSGGTLLQHLKELVLHTDLSPGDTIFFYTTCGWMMWNWLVSALAAGARVVLYDGSPLYPDPGALWRLAAEEQVNVFGISPRFLAASEKAGIVPKTLLAPGALRTVLSTGAPLPVSAFDYVADSLGTAVQLASISGGTDIVSCFALGNPLLPVWRGELQSAGLGMAVDVYSDAGEPVRGAAGELVCTRPFPSMPLGFWNDPDGSAFRAAYFERFPGVWAHGDIAEWSRHGGLIIHGRADAVLNPGGVRMGSAEVCGPAMALAAVVDCLAVGYRPAGDSDESIVLFVVLRDGESLDAGLEERIRDAIRASASPRHVPRHILQVPDLPRTLSGKPVELAVRAVLHGRPVANRDALVNPEALDYFAGRL